MRLFRHGPLEHRKHLGRWMMSSPIRHIE